jgi:hypothetical protein
MASTLKSGPAAGEAREALSRLRNGELPDLDQLTAVLLSLSWDELAAPAG